MQLSKLEKDACGDFYIRFSTLIFAFISRQTANRQDAEDLLLEVFLSAQQESKLMNLPGELQLAWLRWVARNKLIDYYRHQSLIRWFPLAAAGELEDPLLTPEISAERREAYRWLAQALRQLSEEQQELIHLRYGQELRLSEIADLLRRPEGAVRKMLTRTLRKLRFQYERIERSNPYLYQGTGVYNARTGTPVTHYQPHLGSRPVFHPQLVNGIVYMQGVLPSNQAIGKATLFALRPTDGSVLWQWNDCGESDNLDGPVFIGDSVYLTCEAAPANWRLVGLQARTGALLWSEQLPGGPDYPLVGDQQGLYLSVQDQMMAWNPVTGRLLWQRSFPDRGYWINSIYLGQGIVYVSERSTFTALATANGKTLWAYQFRGDYTRIEAALDSQTVYLFTYEQSRPTTVYAVSSLTGVQHWHRQLPANVDWPTLDQGNLYMIYNVSSNPHALSAPPVARRLLALSGSDGHTLWQTEIPWNSHHLSYAEVEPPALTFGAGRIYLVDWRGATSYYPQQQTGVMGAFSERTGALLWSTNIG